MPKDTPRDQARQLLEQAASLSVRGELKAAIDNALEIASRTRKGGLTDLTYRNAKAGDKISDPDRAGLVMRCTKTRKMWFYRCTHLTTGKQVEFHLGDYPETTLEQARAAWEPLRAMRLKGQMPEEGESETITVDELCRLYLRYYANRKKASARADERMIARLILPAHGSKSATAFSADDAQNLINAQAAAGNARQAGKLKSLLSIIHRVATGAVALPAARTESEKNDKPPAVPWIPRETPNPVANVAVVKAQPMEYTPTTQELRGYVQALGSLSYGDVLRLQLLTCARIGEVTGLSWAELDLLEWTWQLPADRAKNGKAHLVMLPAQTVALLKAIRVGQADDPSPYVFPAARNPQKPVNSGLVQHCISDNRQTLGLHPDFSSHTARHACLTQLAEWGYTRDVRDRVSNHLPPQSADAIYSKAALNEPAREALQRWADHLDVLQGENVVLLEEVAS